MNNLQVDNFPTPIMNILEVVATIGLLWFAVWAGNKFLKLHKYNHRK